MMQFLRLWAGFVVVVLASFAVLGYYGRHLIQLFNCKTAVTQGDLS
jgi:hypothetical protein